MYISTAVESISFNTQSSKPAPTVAASYYCDGSSTVAGKCLVPHGLLQFLVDPEPRSIERQALRTA
jgi:hypothetical protein